MPSQSNPTAVSPPGFGLYVAPTLGLVLIVLIVAGFWANRVSVRWVIVLGAVLPMLVAVLALHLVRRQSTHVRRLRDSQQQVHEASQRLQREVEPLRLNHEQLSSSLVSAERLTQLELRIESLAQGHQVQRIALAGLANATQTLRERVEGGFRDERLWQEVQRLLVDVRQVERQRLQDAHFRGEIETNQNRLAEEHARLAQQAAQLPVVQQQIESVRQEVARLRQEVRSALEDLRSQQERVQKAGEPVKNLEGPSSQSLRALEDLEEDLQKRLQTGGVLTMEDLRTAYADRLAQSLGTTPQRVRRWQEVAELMRVPDLPPQVAEALVRSGVRSVEELAAMEPEDVFLRVRAKLARRRPRRTRTFLARAEAEEWVAQARIMRSRTGFSSGASASDGAVTSGSASPEPQS